MSEVLTFNAHALEENSCTVKFTVKGNDGATAVPRSQMSEAVLTFWDKQSSVIINSWDHTDVLDKIGEDGVFTWHLTKDDNPIFSTKSLTDEETHVGTIQITANNGVDDIHVKHSFLVVVENELEEPTT
jgi:hypothetical protein